MCIKECKKGWSFDMSKKYFAGPATILTLLYLDGTKCTSIQVERIRPAMLKWNYDLMSYREEEEIKNGGFGKLEIVRDYQRIDEDDQKVNKFRINDWLLLTFKPENVKEYMDHLGTLERLINGQQEIMQTIAREACKKYPSHEEVKKWMDKLELMFGREQHMYTTPKKNVQKECADKSGENMEGGKMGSPPSPFWFCATLERTVSKVENEASLRRSREISVRLNHDDVPSFSLGLTQDMDNVMENETLLAPDEVKGNEIVLSQSARGKEVDMDVKPLDSCVPAIANVAAKLDRGRRNLKLPATFKSPYVKRVVDICARLSKLDMKVWQLLNDGVGNNTDIIFATKNGCESVRDSVCSLARQGWVAVDVIDSWAALLNIDEEKRNISSPFRLFCHTGMTVLTKSLFYIVNHLIYSDLHNTCATEKLH
uniref:uncharacterized protein LOC122585857 n=1 Tax=Erigeron canadensis TaxID=72917 RepID=UPI001CB90457|nr:uncharacterized protein LOC122585857 [Erigeron canadensis]